MSRSLFSKTGKGDLIEEAQGDQWPGFGPQALLQYNQWHGIIIFRCQKKDLQGKSTAEITEEWNTAPFHTYLDMILEEKGESMALSDYIDPQSIQELVKEL